MWTLPWRGFMMFMTLAIAGFAPVDVATHNEPAAGPARTATVLPAQIYAKNPAFRLLVSLHQPIRDKVTFEHTKDFGFQIAAAENPPKGSQWPRGRKPLAPFEMANEGNRLTV